MNLTKLYRERNYVSYFKYLIIILLFSLTTNLASGSNKHLKQMQLNCLSEAIYKEARGESLSGQLAVGQVVINRTKHKNYPSSICEVIFQKDQFPWSKQFKGFTAPKEYKVLAAKIMNGKHAYSKFPATHFHAVYVNPNWYKLKRVTTIGKHIFYKL